MALRLAEGEAAGLREPPAGEAEAQALPEALTLALELQELQPDRLLLGDRELQAEAELRRLRLPERLELPREEPEPEPAELPEPAGDTEALALALLL